jgi:hypothetical protein
MDSPRATGWDVIEDFSLVAVAEKRDANKKARGTDGLPGG